VKRMKGLANLGIDLTCECELECEFGYRPECSLPLGYVQCKQSDLLGLQPWVPINLRGLGYKGGALKLLASGLRLRKQH
jgi:hypothetical protein